MKTLLLAATSSGLLLSVGCIQERTYLDPEQNLGFDTGVTSNMALRDGRLRGDFGPRRGFDGEATDLQGSNDPEYQMTVVNVVREEERRGAGMVILSVSGRTLDDLEPGEHAFQYDEASLDSTQEIFVNVCGGNDASAFDYDAPAQRGTVTITEEPQGARTVEIHTETPRLDPVTGAETGEFEVSDSSFVYQPSR